MKQNDSRSKIGIFGSVPVFALFEIGSLNELKALVGISSYQGTNENAYPSVEQIAKRIGLSPSATSTAISGLVRKELIARKRNYGRNNTYHLLFETENLGQIREKNKAEKRKLRAEKLKENIDKHNSVIQSFESIERSKVSNNNASKSSNVSHSKVSNIDYSKSSNSIYNTNIKEHNTIPIVKESLPSQDKVEIFQTHHKARLKESRLHGDPDLFLLDKLGQLVDWDVETYDKILNAKKNSKWDVRRNQPNTARWLLATLENENLELNKPVYQSKWDDPEHDARMAAQGFV